MNSMDNTLEFLYLISQHMSNRKELRQVEYQVCINDTIWLCPSVSVFPNQYTRRPGAKLPVIDHIIQYHYHGKLPDLVHGEYKYELSAFKKSRRWTRIK